MSMSRSAQSFFVLLVNFVRRHVPLILLALMPSSVLMISLKEYLPYDKHKSRPINPSRLRIMSFSVAMPLS
jgi:hypothetical protein